ncbi:hypothetical protein A5867_003454 [Enterococcus sp. 6D12_DIV0197]|uniref:dihydrodipicolinate synthase family protein n=1 Tax=Enterococcus TaxID=1350 RepID=UPI000B3EC4F3|nr:MULTISPECIES: dihydrodipicolinate synthase family protein [Enterococcus]MDB1693443.1 dihydrodipicolinate synthase family protein [Enterococcus casseliflavus]MEB6087523.1 dihydrodipicolinate synthase family protein [Enterococcus casseliflavus]OUZ25704.1 hypothetical protein A5867_003454 [Enterococcus sp. 6D12_DIV0197]
MKNLKSNYHIAVPTAFYKDEEVNTRATINHILYLQKLGITSVLVCGSTGEQHSMSLDEKIKILDSIEEEGGFNKDFEIIFGVASVRQKDAVTLMKHINTLESISGILLGVPPYILPNQLELQNFIEVAASSTKKPIILYNNPKRTGIDCSPGVINEVLKIHNIIGIKEAGDYNKIKEYVFPQGKEIYLYSGGEEDLNKKIELGFTRLSSVWGNIYPLEVKNWFNNLLNRENKSFEYDEQLNDLLSKSPIQQLKNQISRTENIDMGVARKPLGMLD